MGVLKEGAFHVPVLQVLKTEGVVERAVQEEAVCSPTPPATTPHTLAGTRHDEAFVLCLPPCLVCLLM